jgi:TRAP-type C4-dicarboxylate transport system substrate-binding protein
MLRTRSPLRWAILILLVAVACPLFSGGQQEGTDTGRKVITLRMTAGHAYASAIWVQTIEDFFIPEIERRVLERTTDYEIDCTGYYGGSLAKLGEVLEAVESGTADMGLVHNVFEQSKLEIFNYPWWMPFVSTDNKQAIDAAAAVMEQFPVFEEQLAKYNQKQIGKAINSLAAFELITTFPINTLEDLKGRKVSHGGSMIPWLEALGAVGVQSTFSEAYTSIDTGVYQGWIMPADSARSFKIFEVAPYYTQVGFGAFVNGYLTINLDTWNALPPEVQEIIAEVGSEYTWELYKKNVATEDEAKKQMAAAGCTISTLSEAERSRWAEVLFKANLAQKAAQKADANGFPGTEVLKAFIKALEDVGYDFPFDPGM